MKKPPTSVRCDAALEDRAGDAVERLSAALLMALVSPYTRLADLARQQFPWVPAALLRYPLSTADALPRVKARTWLAHGGRDSLIPPAHSQALNRLAQQPQLLLVPEAGHNDIHQFAAYLDGLRAELDRL